MKNKNFKKLSAETQQKILMRTLRNKTDGLLKVNEEVALLSIGARRKQFKILTFNDINSFVKALNITDDLSREVIYGDMEMKKLKTGEKCINSGIAVLVSANSNNASMVDQMLIYVPETRRCKGQCVRENHRCEHIKSYEDNAVCCGLQLVQA